MEPNEEKEPRILLVEDDRADREKTLDALRKYGLGYEVRVVSGGREALDYLMGRGRFHERSRHPLPGPGAARHEPRAPRRALRAELHPRVRIA